MRKIVSKQKQEKKKKKNQLIVGIVLVSIMLFSVIGYSFTARDNSSQKRIVYNGIDFLENNGYWFAEIFGAEFFFKYNPKETENLTEINVLKDINDYLEKPLYIYSENYNAEREIYQNLDKVVLRRQYACPDLENSTAEFECDSEWPVKTCEDNFIIIQESENSEVKQEENCIFIYGKGEEIIKATDKFLFEILKVQ